ncbi:hypothetical protein ACA910_001077 [Epithemia clementina (nom. ined.)]
MGFLGEVASSILLFCLVFGMSATVEIKALKKQIQNRMALGIGVVMQFIVLPFVGFCTVKILNLPSTYGVTLLVITSSPGGSYSNWWCSIFNAELALSVTMTTVSTLLSVVMLPTNLILYTRWTYSEDVVESLDWAGLIVSLVIIISGIGGGLYMSYLSQSRGQKKQFHRTANLLGNIAGILLILLSVLVSSTGNNENHKASLLDQDAKFYIGVAMPAFMGLFLAVKLASHYKLEKPERVAVAVEACYQNTGIATSVALALYDGDELATAIGVPLYYGIVEAVLLAAFCIVCWKMGWTKAPPEDNCCKVIFNSYEIHDDEHAQERGDGSSIEGGSGQQTKRDVQSGSAAGDDMDSKRRIPSNNITSRSDDDELTLQETEMPPSSISSAASGGIVVRSSADGAVSVVVEGDDEPPPHVTGFERVMATVRARVAGYGKGQQDEERGLRTKRGPVTLGLSQVPASPQPTRKEKRKKQQDNVTPGNVLTDLPVQGKTLD